jgi:hypothetical protein
MSTLYECPTRVDLPAYTYSIQLDGSLFNLSFTYNDRMDRWMISIADTSGNILIGEVPVIVNYPLFDRYKVAGLPLGTLFAFDTANTNTDPTRYDLGDRVRLYYQSAA